MEGQIHRDIFPLFYSAWSNPESKIHQIVKYLLEMSCNNSGTWSVHLRHISEMYGVEEPLSCLQRLPPSKSEYKEYIMTKISAFYETELRATASTNSSMKYFNVSLLGLRGRHHPAVGNINDTSQVINMRPHVKMLTGDYLTYEKKAQQSGGSPNCRISVSSESESESLTHVIASCEALSEPRKRILKGIEHLCQYNGFIIQEYYQNPEAMTQFILDPSSMNLPKRIHINDPILPDLFKLSRDFYNAIHKLRMKLIQNKNI